MQVPTPAPEPAVAVMLPELADPLPEPLTAPLQLAEVLVALLALQLNVAPPPMVMVDTLKPDDTLGGAAATDSVTGIGAGSVPLLEELTERLPL